MTLSLLSLYWDTSGKYLKQIKLHALSIVKVELTLFAGETPVVFISFRKINLETLMHVNVTFFPVKKYSWLNKYSMKLDSGRTDFMQISAVNLGFNGNRYEKEK